MKLKEATAKIEELEKRIAQLEQRPVYVPVPSYPPHNWDASPYLAPQYPITVGQTPYTTTTATYFVPPERLSTVTSGYSHVISN